MFITDGLFWSGKVKNKICSSIVTVFQCNHFFWYEKYILTKLLKKNVCGVPQSPSGMRSPVPPRVPSPQEISANAQTVLYNALLKKKIQDQNEQAIKKQQEG